MLNREEIRELVQNKALVTGFIDLNTQLTPNGFDLSVKDVFAFSDQGSLDFSNKQRKLPDYQQMPLFKDDPNDKHGWWHLPAGAYKVITNEIVELPNTIIGIAFPRSSLLRMGAFTQTGIWDAGFKGASEFILVVQNPHGLKLKQNSRIVQLMFSSISETKQGYNGVYQGK